MTVSPRIELYFVIDTICMAAKMAVSEVHLSYVGYLNIKYLLYIYMSKKKSHMQLSYNGY
ncbi:hypothetical protein C0J52_22463 [Blattella germanica]|nr:hypothetical protein C0J52_22463 [Blattella germanica]